MASALPKDDGPHPYYWDIVVNVQITDDPCGAQQNESDCTSSQWTATYDVLLTTKDPWTSEMSSSEVKGQTASAACVWVTDASGAGAGAGAGGSAGGGGCSVQFARGDSDVGAWGIGLGAALLLSTRRRRRC